MVILSHLSALNIKLRMDAIPSLVFVEMIISQCDCACLNTAYGLDTGGKFPHPHIHLMSFLLRLRGRCRSVAQAEGGA